MSQSTQLQDRRYDLDWLRVFAILLVLVFHVGMFFVHWPWHIKNPETSRGFGYIMVWLHQWRMPLLLFISGAGTMFAFAKRSKGEFALERTRRLFIPLIFSMFVVVPPQIYFEKIGSYSSYFDFYRTVFDFVPYPMGGSFSWHHMWFVLYLFLYSLVAIPLIAFLRSERSRSFIAGLERYFSRTWGFVSYALLIIVSQAILRPYFPEETHTLIDDWAFATQLFLFFLAGLVVSVSPKLWAILMERRRSHLLVALASLTLMEVLYAVNWDSIQPYLRLDVKTIWDINTLFLAWAWVIAIIGYGQRYLNKKSAIVKQANEGIYPFYILHQSVIIALAYPMIGWEAGMMAKFALLTILSFVATVSIYLIFIRPFNVMRFLFGMKPKNVAEKKSRERVVGSLCMTREIALVESVSNGSQDQSDPCIVDGRD